MTFRETIITAFQSLKMNPKRSFMTIIGIVIGIASVITIMAIGNGVNQMAKSQFKTSKSGELKAQIDFTSDTDAGVNGFTQADVSFLRSSEIGPDITDAKISTLSGDYGSDFGSLNGDESELDFTVARKRSGGPNLDSGHYFSQADLDVGQNNMLISKGLAKRYFGSPENALGKSVTLGNYAYTVIGTFTTDDTYQSDTIIPYNAYLKENNTTGSIMTLNVKKGANPQKIGRKAEKLLKKNGANRQNGTYEYEDNNKWIGQISKVLNGITFFVTAVAGISLFIAGIGVMNMMYISVSERTQEIGIRLAVGATEANIRNQFLIEAIILTVTGGLIGLVSGYLIASGAVKLIPGNMHIKAVITLRDVVFAIGVSTIVGVIFGWLPAKQAANKNLIDILR
ncbi:ABC transporter permease [Weissella viridescens]|jgi:putative ABC transport system permease protein|uniref:ABC transporter permease n=2 Tax=Weissella TaxID=46255 RepID=UPI001C7CAAEE|nr:ABC transporter permease [Weissella viridescens]MBX4173460.1 ABC transporter permease [Weissella viridescens]